MRRKIAIHYEAVELGTIVDYFVKGYSKTGRAIVNHEYFIDTAKGKAIIKLYLGEVPSRGEGEKP